MFHYEYYKRVRDVLYTGYLNNKEHRVTCKNSVNSKYSSFVYCHIEKKIYMYIYLANRKGRKKK